MDQYIQDSDDIAPYAILIPEDFEIIDLLWRVLFYGAHLVPMLLKSALHIREEHLSRLKSLKQDGILVTLGPTEGSTHVFGIFEAETLSVVQQLVAEDVYWREGIWTAVNVYPWTQAF